MTRTILLFASIFFLTNCGDVETSVASDQVENTQDIPELFQRQGKLAEATEWPKTVSKVAELKDRISNKPNDVAPRLQIATIYLAEARITGEHPYYYPAIHKILDGVLNIDPRNFEATVYKAAVFLSQHKFTEALSLGEKAKAINPDNAYVYGILIDANVEMGNYQQAIAMSDKMQSLKPSLESYSRASYLRELHGDFKGAIEAMKLAVQAGLAGSEPQCWSRNILAELYLKTGDLKNAEINFNQNLQMRPSYAPAMAGLAKVHQERKNYEAALALLDSAVAVMPEYSFHEQMAEIYKAQGDNDKSKAKLSEVKQMLLEDQASGHVVSLELAQLYSKMGDWDAAHTLALQEYKQRPDNIHVNSELAWIAFNMKEHETAKKHMQVAMKTGSKDPDLIKRASAINGAKG